MSSFVPFSPILSAATVPAATGQGVSMPESGTDAMDLTDLRFLAMLGANTYVSSRNTSRPPGSSGGGGNTTPATAGSRPDASVTAAKSQQSMTLWTIIISVLAGAIGYIIFKGLVAAIIFGAITFFVVAMVG